ncbi:MULTISPECIES: helix-turn-helix domain-containing protein [Streptomyces]|uniref:helix-turn-helix domain-containing protein n=1 Tax=Streptomyces TaxID=1883 RepID=UPI000A3ADBDB|nr:MULTISPECIES: helix-turn-helix transcriptional regulator [Streptomyces]MDX3522379.1 helix-turn-helix transcriptional regulator [Streptomyces scabiei]
MSDYQHARKALGARLRELRTGTGLTGKEFAALLGWQQSKVSKLENGKQTASDADAKAWAEAVGRPDVADELRASLRTLETTYRSWKRQLAAGHRAVQEGHRLQEEEAREIHIFESGIIPGIFQTPEYARGVLTDVSDRVGSPRDVEAGVQARMQRQTILYEPGRHIHALLWEAALLVQRCDPAAMSAQLERLTALVGSSTVTLGVIPLGARTPFSPKHGFWIMDQSVVVADTWNAELWLESADDVAYYVKVWTLMSESAVFGHQAHRLIMRARAQLTLP